MLFVAGEDPPSDEHIGVGKSEEILPWGATEAASREPYPRKNIYFTGQGQDEIYDWCVWRANVEGYETLTGTARSSSELINDLIKRRFLQDMLDDVRSDRFRAWRAQQLERAGLPPPIPKATTPAAVLAVTSSALEPSDPRFAAFLRARVKVKGATRLAIWHRQRGMCAVCTGPQRLKIYKFVGSNRQRIASRIPLHPDDLVAICKRCYDLDATAYLIPSSHRKRGRPSREEQRT